MSLTLEEQKAKTMEDFRVLMLKYGMEPMFTGEDQIHWHYKLANLLVKMDERIDRIEGAV